MRTEIITDPKFWFAFLTIAGVAAAVFLAIPAGWVVVLILWCYLLFFALLRPSARSFLLGFLIAFFVFLLGRVTMGLVSRRADWALGYTESIRHLSLVVSVSLLSLWFAYWILQRLVFERNPYGEGRISNPDDHAVNLVSYTSSAVLVFWVTIPFQYAAQFAALQTVRVSSYEVLYSQEFKGAGMSGVAAIVQQLGLLSSVAFAVYLASLPGKKQSTPVIAAWLGALVVGLFSGSRMDFANGLLFLVAYSLMRNRVTPSDPWVRRRSVVAMVAAVPVLGALLTFVGKARSGLSQDWNNPLEAVAHTLYELGVSATAITNGFEYARLIPDQDYLREFLHYGLLARLLDMPVLRGNSVELAMSGESFTHSLSYVVLGESRYLAGHGTGSSYIAEAYFTLGIPGVIVISFAYGSILLWIDHFSAQSGILTNSVRLLVSGTVFLAPRGSATGVLALLSAPSTLLGIGAIYLLAKVFLSKQDARKLADHDFS